MTPVRARCDVTQAAKLTPSDAASSDHFGSAVALSGQTGVVGSYLDDHGPTNAGSAYVFVYTGSAWSQQAKLTASDAASNDEFGVSVAVSGNTAVVGSRLDDHSARTDAGSAYVFLRSGTVWFQQTRLFASDAAASDFFGASVAISSNVAVVGAYNDDHAAGVNAGAAYVFVRTGSVWTQQAKLTASDAAAGDQFGFSVAIDGGIVVVGAPSDDHAAGVDAGSAYVFAQSGTVWTEQAKLTDDDAAAGDSHGHAVALSGETAVVGALSDDHAGGLAAGSASVFIRSGGVWTQHAKLVAVDAAPDDMFGNSVAISADTVVVGAHLDDHAGGIEAGAAYLFTRNGSAWTQQAKMTASDAAATDHAGYGVAISGRSAFLGAWRKDNGSFNDAGAAYAFDFTCLTCIPAMSKWSLAVIVILLLGSGTIAVGMRRA